MVQVSGFPKLESASMSVWEKLLHYGKTMKTKDGGELWPLNRYFSTWLGQEIGFFSELCHLLAEWSDQDL